MSGTCVGGGRLRVAGALVVASVVGFFLSEPIIELLRAPLEASGAELIQLTVGEALGVRLQLALYAGAALAMPLILYQAWGFVTPGLTPRERRLAWPLLARIGTLNYRYLAARRRWAVPGIVSFAILATPQDPFSTMILSAVMYALFEGTLQLIRLMRRD